MIFITGPLCSGKKEAAKNILRCDDAELARRAVWDVQELAANSGDLEALAVELARYEVVIATEVGGGVVPVDPEERAARTPHSARCKPPPARSPESPPNLCRAVEA